MSGLPIIRIAQWTLALGLLLAVFAAPGVYAVVAGVLLFMQALALYGMLSPAARLLLSVVTSVIFPLCLEAAGAGFASVLGGLLALPGIADALRRLAASQDVIQRPLAALRDDHRQGDVPYFPERHSTPAVRAVGLAGVGGTALGLATGHGALAGAGAVLLVWLLAMVGFIFLRVPPQFVVADRTRLRGLVGRRAEVSLALRRAGRLPCRLYLRSPVSWVVTQPSAADLDGQAVPIHLAVTPPLAGPSRLVLEAVAVDPWGLIETGQEVDVADLHIIPRARYATWLAQRYLDRTPPGSSTLMVSVTPRRWGARGGVEYYGARAYAPGDTLREIDWKHTLKLGKLIVKEFRTAAGGPAIILVNLEVPDADSADRLAFRLVMTTLTLAQEGIPIVLAGYTQKAVSSVTPLLSPRDAVLRALSLTERVVRVAPLRRTLGLPRIGRLRRMWRQLEETGSAGRLADLIALEIRAITDQTTASPAAKAAQRGARNVPPPAAILSLSAGGEEATALDVTLERLNLIGYRRVSLRLPGEASIT